MDTWTMILDYPDALEALADMAEECGCMIRDVLGVLEPEELRTVADDVDDWERGEKWLIKDGGMYRLGDREKPMYWLDKAGAKAA